MLFIINGERYCRKGCPEGTELKVVEHPGWSFNGIRQNSFPNKYAVISSKGSFYGHQPYFIEKGSARDIDCLTAFGLAEAHRFALEQMEVAS